MKRISAYLSKKFVGVSYFVIILIVMWLSCSKKGSTSPVIVTPPASPTPVVIPPINTNATTAKEIIVDMGAGFNLGNTFESNTSNSPTLASAKPIIDLYYDAGMRHIRIPATWLEGFPDNIADANGAINTAHPRLLELKTVVEYALSKKMYVVINTHHEHWLKNHYDGTAAFDDKFKTLWTGIANFFNDQPKQLLFDILNEPEGTMGEWSGSGYPLPNTAQQLALTRQINKVAYDAVRATGGNNTTRFIMVEPNGQGNQGMMEQVYPGKTNLPGGGTDIYLAIQVHTYDPWAFCGETGTNGAWPGRATIESAIKKVSAHAKLLDVPVNYGEFGVGRKSGTERDSEVVRGYYKLVKQTTLAENMSFTVWDDRGWFGLIVNGGSGWAFTNNIVPSMMAQ